MCGICGILNFQKDNLLSDEVLKRMSQSMVHRGPDDEGIYLGRHTGLAVRRLSIIDLISGHQPIHNEDESIWLVLNGEIYNYKELRLQLQNLGHHFYTNSDTEVVIHTYEQYGENSVTQLRGMFAFALWDEKKEVLLLARDRLGIKPLYYSTLSDKIIFASDIKSILQSGIFKPELDLHSVDQFFSFSYVPGPQTIFRKIQKLLPAHILFWTSKGIRIKEYWQIDYSKKIKLSENECLDRLSEFLEDSIRLHLRSDVPIGIFLSGGIDSSTITYLVDKQVSSPIKTFSIGFDDERFNELDYARVIANHFKTEHHEELITDKAIDSLPQVIEKLSEPLADISIIPTYFVSKMASSKVKVVLSGEGGDEMFAGYPWYRISKLVKFYQNFPLQIRQKLANIIKDKNIKMLEERSYFYRRIRRFLLYSSLPVSGRYLWRRAYFNQELKDKLFSEEFKDNLRKAKSKDNNNLFPQGQIFEDFLIAMLYFDTKLFLPDDLLAKMDQMTMAHSIEGRVPFLDHRLVEFVVSLPSEMKLYRGTSKYILRKLVSSKLPKEILSKPKQGLVPPIEKWVNKRFDDFFISILHDRKTQERFYFNQPFVNQMVKQYKKGYVDYSYQFWTLALFELWLRTYLK